MAPPVVLVHGFGTSFELTWVHNGWVDLLADEGREVIGVDLLGHGGAPKPHDPAEYADHAFTLIFPQWDMVTVILGVFLMGYVVGEGKSNYFKGSSLILTYLVFIVGFYFSGFNNIDVSFLGGA